MVSTMVGHTTGVNMAVDHWVEDLDITRTRVSAIWTVSLFLSGAFLPLAGALIDKLGSRKLAGWIPMYKIYPVGCNLRYA